MLYEYAVEPKAIASSWQTFRYVIEKFGFDKGRLISEFPRKAWFTEVYAAASVLAATDKARLEILLNQAKGTKVVRMGRPYNRDAGDWMVNALIEHKRLPFRAIVASQNGGNNPDVLLADDMNESYPAMAIVNNVAVPRDATSITFALSGFIEHGSRVLFVDPYFDFFDARYKSVLNRCLRVAKEKNPDVVCEIHYRHHERNVEPSHIELSAAGVFPGVIPTGMKIRVFCWREKKGGADFHARYLLTDKGGIGIEAGFAAEGSHQTVDMYLLGLDLCKEKLGTYTYPADSYELVGPVLLVDANGQVSRI